MEDLNEGGDAKELEQTLKGESSRISRVKHVCVHGNYRQPWIKS